MKFPGAQKGIGKIFTSEILYIIGTALTVIGGISVIVAAVGNSESKISDSAAGGALLGGGAFALIGFLVLFVGAIIQLVGMIQAAKDEEYFKYSLFALIAQVVIAAIGSAAFSNTSFQYVADAFSKIAELVVLVLMVQGIINIANKLQNVEVAQRGLLVFKLIICIGILEIIARFIDSFTRDNNDIAKGLVVAIAISCGVLAIVKYIVYLTLLSRAKKMLSE